MRKQIESVWTGIKEEANVAKDVVSLRRRLSTEKDLLDDMLKGLGEMTAEYYENGASGSILEEEGLEALCAAITAKKEELTALRRSYNALLGRAECGGCGRLVNAGFTFCPYCGEKLEKPLDAEAYSEDAVFEDDLEDIAGAEGLEEALTEAVRDIKTDGGEGEKTDGNTTV